MNSRSVSPKTWEHARQALVFYFASRHGLSDAEDLAHQTLVAILSRDDFEFEKEEDFLKVCYGFATHILQAARRDDVRDAIEVTGGTMITPTAETGERQGLRGTELCVYLDEVLRVGKNQLREEDWRLIENSAASFGGPEDVYPDGTSAVRVKLHRARRKLARLVGWRKG